MIQLVQKFISDYKYRPEKEEFRDYFFSHPDFPSLYAVTDTMDYFGIDNLAAKINNEQLSELPNQFLTLISVDQQDVLVYVTQHNDKSVTYLDEKNLKKTIFLTDFITNWTQIVIVIDENENRAIERDSPSNYVIMVGLIILLISLFHNHFFSNTGYVPFLYSFFGLIGLVLSVLLVQESFGVNKEITSKICNIVQPEGNGCQSVLRSSVALIYKNFTLSDVCLVFFSALILLLALSKFSHLHYIIISLFSLPIVIFSLYYQYLVIKKWCALCLGISMCLVGISIVTLFSFHHFSVKMIVNDTLLFLEVLFLLTVIWVLLKPMVLGYFELKNENRGHRRFKRNINTFKALLNNTFKINQSTLKEFEFIEIGSRSAQNELLLFLSPSCGHCHTAFKDAISLIDRYPENLKLKIGFNVNPDNENNPYTRVLSTIVDQSIRFDNAKELLSKWHIDRIQIETFNSTYGISTTEEAKDVLRLQFNWCQENGFNYTPVKIFNKKVMPSEYGINDLSFFIKEFDED